MATPRARQTEAREAEPREAAARELGPGEALGRDGKVIRRQSVSEIGNKYDVPDHIIVAHQAEGFALEWKRVATYGQEDHSYIAQTARGGWTPVPNERWPDVFLPGSFKGPIVIDGQMLMERPLKLQEEAAREDRIAAINQANGSRKSIGMQELASGFEDHNSSKNPQVRQNTFVRSEMSQVDTPKPKYNYDKDVTLD